MPIMNSLKSLVQMNLEFMLIVIDTIFNVVENQGEISVYVDSRLHVAWGWVLEV